MSNQEGYRLIIAALKKVKERPKPFRGICSNFDWYIHDMLNKDRLTLWTFSQLLDHVKTATTQWPEYSGHRNYPVYTNPKTHPAIQFNKTWFYWTRLTSYGRARRRLLDFLINHFEELVKQHE